MMADRRQGLVGPHAGLRALGLALLRQAARALAMVLYWQELSRQRRALLELDERMLKDIGITRGDAAREARRPLWDDAAERWRDWR